MMKKYIALIVTVFALCGSGFAAVSNNLAGKYTCNGYDKQDKTLSGTNLILTLDPKNSMLQNGYAAYTLEWIAPATLVVKGLPPNVAASGAIAANGNMLALMFKNNNPKAQADYGVLIGTATHDQNAQGISNTVLHFFGYQPIYKSGDNSTWVCTK